MNNSTHAILLTISDKHSAAFASRGLTGFSPTRTVALPMTAKARQDNPTGHTSRRSLISINP